MKKHSVSFEEAQKRALELASLVELSAEWVNVLDALGRTACSDVICTKNLPSYNNAAMDGFAFKYDENNKYLRIKKRILAGDISAPCLDEHECYKIMTGAKVPDDADTIIPFEECAFYDDASVELSLHVKKGNALRCKGEEQTCGTVLIQKGEVLNSTSIALLASQGMMHVEVYRKLKIAILSTGDELKKPWEHATEDEIYDVNAFALIALLKEQGFDAVYGGVVPDNLDVATRYFQTMMTYDVLVTSGGVSMGEADFVEQALMTNGFEPSFHGIEIKPGKPTMMGKMSRTIVASMPGNPLAAYVNAFLFLVPLLKKAQGQINFNFSFQNVLHGTPLKLKKGRVNLILGSVIDGYFEAYDNNRYGSGMIKPLLSSTSILISDEKRDCFEKDEVVKIISFKAFFTSEKKHLIN